MYSLDVCAYVDEGATACDAAAQDEVVPLVAAGGVLDEERAQSLVVGRLVERGRE